MLITFQMKSFTKYSWFMLGQILILHNSQNLSSLSTSSHLSNKKKLIALIGSVNENVARFSVHVHVSLISNLTYI